MDIFLGTVLDNNERHALKKVFLEKGLTLAVSESLTCGLIQATIGTISGASNFFIGGATTYWPEAKVKLLHVDPEAVAYNEAVSEKVAVEMARGICKLFHSNLGLGTTGFAELEGERPYAYIAICKDQSEHSGQIVFSERIEGEIGWSRDQMRQYVSRQVLLALVDVAKFG
ncbi:MAG: CinA family protein [Bacteroidota bacterium]